MNKPFATGAIKLVGKPAGGMPPEARVAMPEQALRSFDPASRREFVNPRSRSRLWPRIFVLGGATAITAGTVFEMGRSLALGGLTPVEGLIVFLFALNLGWIALTFVTALAGAVIILSRRPAPRAHTPIAGRTAVLMPTYNENPTRIFAAIEAMASGVRTLDKESDFDWFVLSDTTDPVIALTEETAFVEMRAHLGSGVSVYYRRRNRNVARKAGNISDFCRRWGGAYDYLLVLDADSLMEPESILELARRMDADPDAGLIQTVPRLVLGSTGFARLHQFAGRVYGPVIAAGLAWWTGSEGNYWGHNAIIRRKAFTEAAGLPSLPGKPPFGGHILSHDFVEAALIRRAGWTVRIADDIAGSYEETPPSLVDFAVRDRRWCQGNLQHARIVTAKGLHWVSRFHLVSGIFSYVASPLWLLLIIAGLGLAVQASFMPPDYFEDPHQLFPTWPRIDSQLQIELLVITVAVLLGPKLFGLATVLLRRDERRKSGGPWRLTASFFLELLLSVLVAPVMMVIQSGVIVSILSGGDSGWKSQRREGDAFTLRDAFRCHRWHMAAGLGLAAAAWYVQPFMLAWLSPAVIGLVLAAPVSRLTASAATGKSWRRLGLLITPEERAKPRIGRATMVRRPRHRATVSSTPDIRSLVLDDSRRDVHMALVDDDHDRMREDVDPIEAMAAAKIDRSLSLEEALSRLRPEEQAIALAAPVLFARLSALASANQNKPQPAESLARTG
jgi:membrane glycosyltransferase